MEVRLLGLFQFAFFLFGCFCVDRKEPNLNVLIISQIFSALSSGFPQTEQVIDLLPSYPDIPLLGRYSQPQLFSCTSEVHSSGTRIL